MNNRDNSRAIASSTGACGPLAMAESSPGNTDGEDWAWMVAEDPAFYLRKARTPLDKRGA